MPAPDLKEHLQAITKSGAERLVKDLKAIPADKQNVSPGGCARAPLHYVAECGMLNGFLAGFLSGAAAPRPNPEEREKVLSAADTEEKALAMLQDGTDKLLAAIAALDPETLGDTVEFFGRTWTRLAVAELPASHMSYHDGQLNYVHTLCGDSQVHW